MVYFKALRCNECGLVMHTGCSNAGHFCRQMRQNPDGQNKISDSPQAYSETNSFDWQFMSLPVDQLRCSSTCQTTNRIDNAVTFYTDHSNVGNNDLSLNRPCSALPFTSTRSSGDSSSAFPFPALFADNATRTDSPCGSNSSAAPRSPIEHLSNNLASNIRQLKSWWQSRRRRNSKELINRANAEDKHVRSRFSLSCDEKQARKTLQQLIKSQSKKDAKVRFESQLPTIVGIERVMSPETTTRTCTGETQLIQSHSVQHGPIKSALSRTRLFYPQINSPAVSLTNTSSSDACTSEHTKVIAFQQKLKEIRHQLLFGNNSTFGNQEQDDIESNQPNELISSGQHFYCASKVSCRRRTIPKLFQAQDAQLRQALQNRHLEAQLQEDKHLALTKARTLSMEAKSAVCESFLATWPTSSTVVGNEDDFLPNEEELSLHLFHENDLNEDVDEIIKEWCIPSKNIQFKELLRESRTGEIYRGHWHGDVLIYTFTKPTSRSSNSPCLSEFTKELAQLTKVRHENIMLFMGACIEPNHLAVVTSMQKGCSVYDSLHVKQQSLSFPSKLNILRQVAQAMGYLHARGIVHKKISSNNIIIENKVKICLMDQGVNSYAYHSKNYALLPKGHLTYLSPQLIRSLYVDNPPHYYIKQQHTKESDVYAFGTLLYEILSNHYPFAKMVTEMVVWQIGNGRHQSVEGLKCDSILKSLLSQCWSVSADKRPSFKQIVKRLQENVSLHKRHSSSEPERLNKLVLSKLI